VAARGPNHGPTDYESDFLSVILKQINNFRLQIPAKSSKIRNPAQQKVNKKMVP